MKPKQPRCKDCGAMKDIPAEKWSDPTFNTVCPATLLTVQGMCFCAFWHERKEVAK